MTGLPSKVAPMLATPGPVPEGDGWAYEFKWDGVRAVASVAGGDLRVQSRNDKPLADMYPELSALHDLLDRAVTLDGEIVALDEQGRPDFGLLQQRMHRHGPPAELLQDVPVLYYVFDVMHLDGEDLTRLPVHRSARCAGRSRARQRCGEGAAVVCRCRGRHHSGHRR